MKYILLIIIFQFNFFCSAQICTDGTMGATEKLVGPNFQIDQSLGLTNGNNLFHSFSELNLENGQSATFTGASNITNIIGRITGGQSYIDGQINCSIVGANLFLLNQAGILFGANATLNLSGSFHASTASYLQFANGDQFFSNPIEGNLISSASPVSFGFLGNSGGITVNGSQLTVADGKELTISSNGLTISNGAELKSAQGVVGLTAISTGELELRTNQISSGFMGAELTVNENSRIDSGGKVFIKGGEIFIDSSTINNITNGDDDNSMVNIIAKDLTISNGSYIKAYTNGKGNAADIIINATSLLMSDSSIESRTSNLINGGVAGNAGDIILQTKKAQINNSYIQNISLKGNGKTGDISIISDDLVIQDDSIISNSKLGIGIGKCGSINLDVTNYLTISGSQIVSETVVGTVEGGDINVNAQSLTLSDHATISSSSRGMADAGNLNVQANTANILSGSLVETSALFKGDGGSLTLSIDGTLTIDGTFSIEDGKIYNSQILSRSVALGDGGNININSGSLSLTNGGTISTASEATNSPGDAGSISINSNSINIANGGQITAESLGSVGGQINIDSVNYLSLYKSEITTAVHNGVGNAGNITINTDNLVLNSSFIRADALGGDGGDIWVDSLTIIRNYGSFFDASSQLGLSGELIINAPQVYINEETKKLVTEFLPAEQWVKDSARSRLGNVCSFIVSQKLSLDSNPLNLLLSPVMIEKDSSEEVPEELKQLLDF